MIRSLRILLLTLLPLAYVAAQAKGDAAESKIFPFPINQVTLDNGLKIVSIPFDSPGIVAYYTVVRTGSRNEIEPGKSGFAHFFEHMMFRGTEKYSKDKFNDVLKSIGADNNAYTSDDETVYHTMASADALETIMDLESDRFMNLKYTEEDFKTEAGAILGEYNKSSSSPFNTIDEKLRDAAFGKHTYQHTTIGFLKDIQDMPNQYQYSLEFFKRWYRPENCVVVIVGDFDQQKLIDLAKKYYSNWKPGVAQIEIPQEPAQKGEVFIQVPWKAKTLPILTVAYHGPAFSDKDIDMPAMDLFSQVVFGQTSDLYKELVVEKQLVEFIEGSNEDHRDPYLFTIFTRIKDPKNIDLVRDRIYAALDEARTKPVSAERLADIKSHMKYQYAMGLDNPNSVANGISHYIYLTGDPESVNRIYALYDKVTPDDIMAVAKKYFAKENRTVVLLTQADQSKSGQEVKQ
ncbi:MAG: insulinase family protein [Ignavibacteriae bacterium]|nr:insulinase family protein [Ignavibacteria bacterium]MBI3364318.1 insulinase family protein [Ignavibacteriota bacterium]